MRTKTCAFLAIAVLGSLLLPAPPASAADPPASFLPDEDGVGILDGNRLSDRFDGVDSRAHLTMVAAPSSLRAEWFVCPQKTDDLNGMAGFIDQVELAECTKIGQDDEPNVPAGAPATDEAYELFWDIPAAQDSMTRDILVLECVGDVTIVGLGGTCAQTLEENIVLDDAQAGGRTTSGDIYQICTAYRGLLSDPCRVGGDLRGGGQQTYAGATELFHPFDHGDVVPNDGFVLRARTSNDALSLAAFIDGGADRATEPDAHEERANCSDINAGPGNTEWECAFVEDQVPVDATMAIWIVTLDAGPGHCEFRECILDSHFAASARSRPESPVAHFVPTPANDDVEAGASCGTPDVDDASSPGTVVRVHGCLRDQFGRPFFPFPRQGDLRKRAVTFEQDAASPGSLKCVVPEDVIDLEPARTAEDVDGDGDVDRCSRVFPHDLSLEGYGYAEYPVDLVNAGEAGSQTVTFCVDDERDPANPQHGCADEAVTAMLTHNWGSGAGRVFLAFADPPPADPADPCRTGAVSRTNRIGDTDTLIACTFDAAGNAAATDAAGGGQLRWSIDTGGSPEAVEFVGSPATETDNDGNVTVDIQALREGTNFIRVDFVDDAGGILGTAQVEKRVTDRDAGAGRVRSSVTIRRSFGGRVISDESVCAVGRKVVLKKKRPGKDKRIGADRTNALSRWKLKITRPNGRYYAKIRRTSRCTGDKSGTVLRRRPRAF